MKLNTSHILLFLLFTGCLFMLSCNDKKTVTHVEHKDGKEEVYTCPMHPEIIKNAPGTCPICGMDLVKRNTGTKTALDIELDALLKPTNQFVISSVPLTAPELREEGIELKVLGSVAYDPRQAASISSRVNGRIEKLYVRYKYQPVKKGQRVMDIYSPELLAAQQNLLFLLRNDASNNVMINAAKERLLLMGMSAGQVAEVMRTGNAKYSVPVFSNYSGFVTDFETNNDISEGAPGSMQPLNAGTNELKIREGMYVQSGQSVFSIYNSNKVWILLDLFPEQQSLLAVGNAVRVVPETAPQENFRARIDYIEPVFRPGSKSLTARVYFNNASLKLPVGSRVTATVFAKSLNSHWLPVGSILSLGKDKIVFKKVAGGFRAQKVTTGMQLPQYIEVTGGINIKDSVVMNAQFLVDNEAFLKVEE